MTLPRQFWCQQKRREDTLCITNPNQAKQQHKQTTRNRNAMSQTSFRGERKPVVPRRLTAEQSTGATNVGWREHGSAIPSIVAHTRLGPWNLGDSTNDD